MLSGSPIVKSGPGSVSAWLQGLSVGEVRKVAWECSWWSPLVGGEQFLGEQDTGKFFFACGDIVAQYIILGPSLGCVDGGGSC